MTKIDISLVVTFHDEGLLAHSTLNSIDLCRRFAENNGVRTEYIWVMDAVSEETRRVLIRHPSASKDTNIIEVNNHDLGLSRNAGVAKANGDTIAILDGDDYYSKNWIERACAFLSEYGDNAIMHPEVVVSFGVNASYCWQIDQHLNPTAKEAILTNNLWTSWTVARKSVYEDYPYSATKPQSTGFGFEDWHWNCQTISGGMLHRTAPGTVGFYRRKSESLVKNTVMVNALIPTTSLFDPSLILSNQP
jgi:glycosyltransferase involved in cell wall biosynthesis